MAPDVLLTSLRRRKEISITVLGRRSGRKITLPVWFVFDDGSMWLLPIHGTQSQWFQNVVADHTMVLAAGRARRTVEAEPVTGQVPVRPVVDLFRKKYGRSDVSRYYNRFDAAVRLRL